MGIDAFANRGLYGDLCGLSSYWLQIVVNLDARTVEVDGRPIHLTRKEYQILELLNARKGATLTRERFSLNHLYRGNYRPRSKILELFISKLRKNLSEATMGENYIQTVWEAWLCVAGPHRAVPLTPSSKPTA